MQTYGFDLIQEQTLSEVGGVARLWKHGQSGAELLSICNKDENKCFGVTFFTPPVDSTGVAHILEHSVLCGSDRYPVKEPFVELLKGSLQTFLNAFTFPDKTCYPVASANLQDFYNLIDVYMDAVFHPLLSEDIFKQEGWHVEAFELAAPWIFKGVVYNEMKGVYSSPDSVLAEKTQQAVFPDNLYSLDSGGNPEIIPNLTYQAFCDFHSRYYQPGNARFFFWGDDPEEERLRIVASEIEGAGPATDLPRIALQKALEQPKTLDIPYAAAEGEERALCTVSWLLGERGDPELAMKMEMLEHILEGLPGSPLRRALLESGLGEDTTGCGLETDLRQMYYSTGLKGIQPAHAGQVEDLVIRTLRDLAKIGIDREAVEAAVNSVEFAYRENNSGRFPRGLAAMISSLSTWLYGGNPLGPLAWEQPLADIKSALARGDKVFEGLIEDWFLNNQHRVRVTLLPDPELARTREEGETARLATLKDQTSQQGREEAVRDTERLLAAQTRPDKPEDLAKIPQLGIRDLPLQNTPIPCEATLMPQTFLAHELPTNGIAYVSLLLPVSHIPARLVPYLPLFGRSLVDFGTREHDYVQLGMRIASTLGGLGTSALLGASVGQDSPFAYLMTSGKATYDHLDDLFALIGEILLEPQKDLRVATRRLGQMLMEEKARLEYSLQAAGHGAVSLRVRAHYSGEGALAEETGGISQLEFLRGLVDRLEKEPQKVLADLEELRLLVLSSSGAIVDCTAESGAIDKTAKLASDLLARLPNAPRLSEGRAVKDYRGLKLPAGEAFITPGQVNYVGWGGNLYALGYEYSGSASVIMRWLRMGRLWEDVRVAGGAYGVFCNLDRVSGTMVCASYRDPNVDRTLSAYEGMADYLRSFTPTSAQLTQAIVGAVGELDTYLLPDARGARALAWYLAGLTPETRQQAREEMLATTAQDFRKFADVLAAVPPSSSTCVIGGSGAARASAEHHWKEKRLL